MTERVKQTLKEILKDEELLKQVLDFLEEEERRKQQDLLQRQKRGYDKAKAQGVRLGRPKKELSDWNKVVEDWEQGQITQSEAAQALGISKKTFYNRVKKGKKASN